MKFIFEIPTDVVRYPADYMSAFGYENDEYEMFHEEVIAMDGEEIVKLTKTLTGYYDITFNTGHILHAISAENIIMRPV